MKFELQYFISQQLQSMIHENEYFEEDESFKKDLRKQQIIDNCLPSNL